MVRVRDRLSCTRTHTHFRKSYPYPYQYPSDIENNSIIILIGFCGFVGFIQVHIENKNLYPYATYIQV